MGKKWGNFYLYYEELLLMATIKPIIKGSGPTSTIYLRLRSGRKHDYTIKTDFIINSAEWSNKNNRPKDNSEKNKNIKYDLDELCFFVQKELNQISRGGLEPTKIWLENVYNSFVKKEQKNQNATIEYWIKFIIENPLLFENSVGSKGLSTNRIKNYKSLLTVFKEYQNNHTYKVLEVNQLFYDNFFVWMLNNKSYKHNTAKKISDDLIAVARHTLKYDIPVSSDLHYIRKVKRQKSKPIILEKEEIKKISKAKIQKDYLINARKWLLLGLQLAQRVSDLLPLNEKNIQHVNNLEGELIKCLVFNQKKSQGTKEIIIPLDDEIEEIIKDGFPRKISPQRFNEFIKEICAVSGIDSPTYGEVIQVVDIDGKKTKRKISGTFPKWMLITSHTIRKTATTHYYQVFGAKVKHITGHSKEETVNTYVNEERSRKLSQVQKMRSEYNKSEKNIPEKSKLTLIKKTS